MLQIYEASVTGSAKLKGTGEKLTSTLRIAGALSENLAKELGNAELYRKDGILTNFTTHGFDYNIQAAKVWFYPLPGTPAENDPLLHIPSCSVADFQASKNGAGALVSFNIKTDIMAVPITEFLDRVRGWNGRLDIEELQQELPLEEVPSDLPKPPKKRGRSGKSDVVVEAPYPEHKDLEFPSSTSPAKSGKARISPHKAKSGKKRPSSRKR